MGSVQCELGGKRAERRLVDLQASALLAMAFAVSELLFWIPLTKLPLPRSMIRELLGAQRGRGMAAGRDTDLWGRVRR